jgi:hypothetical protein
MEAHMSGIFAFKELLRVSRVPNAPVAHASTPCRDRAKLVLCVVDGRLTPALVPDAMGVNLERLLSLTGAGEIRFGREDDNGAPAAEPVFVDVRLALAQEIVFTTGTAEETALVTWTDFARTVRPIVGDFAEPARDRVGAYRLSCRE